MISEWCVVCRHREVRSTLKEKWDSKGRKKTAMEGVTGDGMKSPPLSSYSLQSWDTLFPEYLTKLLSAEIQGTLETSFQAPQDIPMETAVES